jgi:hypothetical protein
MSAVLFSGWTGAQTNASAELDSGPASSRGRSGANYDVRDYFEV